MRATYQYDGLQRRVARVTPAGTTTYHYGDPRSPWLLTAYQLPGEPLVVLRYDDLGHLLKMEQGGVTTWVATDTQGSVRALVDASGNVIHADGCCVVAYGISGMLVVSLDGLTFVTTLERASELGPLLNALPGSLRYNPGRPTTS